MMRMGGTWDCLLLWACLYDLALDVWRVALFVL